MKTLNIVGAGRVARTLGLLLHQHTQFKLLGVAARSVERAQACVDFIGGASACASVADLPEADLWMLAVPDDQIAAVAQAIAKVQPPRAIAMAFHCSGALGCDELQALRERHWPVASAHCLLSFADPALACMQFPGTPCALEGDHAATDALQPAFTAIGAQCFPLASQHKLLYHAAAVFATNFLPVLQHLAEGLWQVSGMPEALVKSTRSRLLQNSVDNIVKLGPRGALTGPASRGDTALVDRQAQALDPWHTEAALAYRALSRLAAGLAGHPTEHTCPQDVSLQFSATPDVNMTTTSGLVAERQPR